MNWLNNTSSPVSYTHLLSAPEDASVQDQLNAMSVEERGKLAVTMLVTGMYMAEGNSTGAVSYTHLWRQKPSVRWYEAGGMPIRPAAPILFRHGNDDQRAILR